MKLVLNLVSVCLLLGLARGFEDKTIYQYLVDNKHARLVSLLQQSKLNAALDENDASTKGPFTLFAPSEAALAAIDPALQTSFNAHPTQLKLVLQYHVLSGFDLVPILNTMTTGMTLSGQAVTFSHSTGKLMLNGNVNVTTSDIVCQNGVVHLIDGVLMPPVFGTHSITEELILHDEKYQETMTALTLADLTEVLRTGEYTLFAPTNAAWAIHVQGLLHPQIHNRAAIFLEILKYMIVPGARFRNQLHDGDKLYTLHGSPLTVNTTSLGLGVDRAHIIGSEVPAYNGVIYSIDDLLFPMDLLATLKQLYYAEHGHHHNHTHTHTTVSP